MKNTYNLNSLKHDFEDLRFPRRREFVAVDFWTAASIGLKRGRILQILGDRFTRLHDIILICISLI